jgi:hypothetical protein
LTSLPNYQAYVSTLFDDEPTCFEVALPPPVTINPRPHRLIANSRVRFGRNRATVEGKIARFLAA